MNTPKHTPGPWFTNEAEACIWARSGRRAPVATVFTAEDPTSEGSPESGVYSPEESANAALIAAAPELLEALRNFIATIDVSGGVAESDCGLSAPVADPEWCDLGDAYHQARAAIAKAEGRE